MVVATWMATAAAQAPTWGLGAGLGPWLAADTRPGASPDFDLATAVRAGVAVRPPLWLATEWALALSEGGVRWAPRAQVEILNPGATFRPGLTAGISAQGASSTDPEVAAPTRVVPHWGLSAAAKVQRTWLRFDARHSLDTSDPRHPAHHVVTTLGLEWLPAPAEPDPVVEVPPPPPAPTPAPTFTVSPAGQVWVSHPLCAWVSAADAPALIATAPHPVTVVAPGYRPVVIDPASPRDLVLEPAAHGGAVVVAAAPGDHVFVDDTPVPVGPDGVALVNTPNALVAVRIEGGGRQVDVELAPADGWGVWYRASATPVVEVRFPQGSATPGPEVQAIVSQLVGLAADRRYRLQGSYSPEGDEVANQRLAVRRAEAVRDLLVARGLDPARLELLPVSPLPSDDPAASRVVVVSSTGPEGP